MGRIRLTGATSGFTELRAANAAGNNTITLPTTTGGEVIVSDSSGNVNIDSGTFYVDASNNRVGIGNTTPSYLLDLLGSAPRIRVKDSSTGAAFHHFENNSGNFYLGIDNSTGGSLSAGNYARVLWSQGAYPLVFATNDTQRAQIDSSGRLLVGTSTTASNAAFQVQGVSGNSSVFAVIRAQRGSTPADGEELGYYTFGDKDSANSAATILAARDGGTWTSGTSMPTLLTFNTCANGASTPTERMRIGNGGLTSIGGVYTFTTGNAANVNVDSSGYLQRSTSSIKYKTNVETLDDQYADALLACRPVWYRSTCEHDCPEHSYWGFIAEEVAAIDPRLVHWKTTEITHDENGAAISTPCTPEPEGVQYERFVPHLLNLIKRQKEQIEAMEARLTVLESA